MHITKSNSALLLLLLFSAVAFSWNKNTACNDTIKNNTTPADANLKGFVVFNKANISTVRSSVVVKGLQIVLVLEPESTNTEIATIKIKTSVCKITKKVATNTYAKYAKSKTISPVITTHKTLLKSLQHDNTGIVPFYDFFNDKINMGFKTSISKKGIADKCRFGALSPFYTRSDTITVASHCSKLSNPFVTAAYFYGSSAFANRPPPGSSC